MQSVEPWAEPGCPQGRSPWFDSVWFYNGKTSLKKGCLLSGIAQITPPPPSFRATWSSFFRRQKQRIARMTEISTDDDDDGWPDNYDGDDDNIDEIYDKNYQKIY